ncbi:MAG TPA: hypothetical protein VGJ54_14025, partial [Streptosporangiaceae bacterium]
SAPAAPAWYQPCPQQNASVSPAIAPGAELGRTATHVAANKLKTGSLAHASRVPRSSATPWAAGRLACRNVIG